MSSRRTTLATLLAVVLLTTGCATSTQAPARYEKRPTEPIALSSVRVIFIETHYKLTGERPWLSSEQVNAQRAMLSTAFRAEFPKAMQAVGIRAEVKTFADTVDLDGAEARQWIGRWPDQPHLLLVRPYGGKVFCTGGPCNFRFGVDVRLFSTKGPALQWSAMLQQPDVTPSLTVGQAADYEHLSREIARVLLQDTTAKPKAASKP